MTKIQQKLYEQIQDQGSMTIRRYDDGRGERKWNAAQRLREAGLVGMRGVRTPRNADFDARSVYAK